MADTQILKGGGTAGLVKVKAKDLGDGTFAEQVALAAGTVNIGDVDIASALPAGENLIGEVAGRCTTVSAEFTRENNATPYGIGDVISASAASPALLELPNIFRKAGGNGSIMGVRVTFNVKSVTPVLRVHFFNASNPTISGDNLPHQEKYADVGKRLGYIELAAMETGADTTNSDMSRAINISNVLNVVAAAGSRSLWVLLETRTAVTLTAQSKVTIAVTLLE